MKKFALILLTLVLAVPAFSQGRFGKDSAECTKYLSYYQELYKQKNMAEAAPFWRKAFSLCPPTASQNMIINGQSIIRYEIGKNQKNPARYKELVDTLLTLHDVRALYFPKYAVKSQDNKAIDIINYCASDNEMQYKVLTAILENIQGNASPVVFVNQMKSCVEMYRNEKLGPDDVMNNYNKICAYLDAKIESSNDPQYRDAKGTVESLLIDSNTKGTANCVHAAITFAYLILLFVLAVEVEAKVVDNLLCLLRHTVLLCEREDCQFNRSQSSR